MGKILRKQATVTEIDDSQSKKVNTITRLTGGKKLQV